MRTHQVLNCILVKMSQLFNTRLGKAQQKFLSELFRVLLAMHGRVTFTNLARFSALSERTFRRHFERAFDWLALNLVLMRLRLHPEEPVIGVFDTTFIEKAGKSTYGLDRFFSSKHRQNRRGLEVSLLGSVGTLSRCAVGLDATQTPPKLATTEHGSPEHGSPEHGSTYSRCDFYLEQITDCLDRIDAVSAVRYWVGDGFYAKAKFFDAICGRGRELITRLRSDANLRFLAQPDECSPTGRKRRYAGKVDFRCITATGSRFAEVGALEDLPQVRLYTALVNSPHLKRDLRIVVLYHLVEQSYVVLCTSDLAQAAEEVVSFFRLRFQIELLIRDAKQHTGLGDAQARDEAKLDFHFNMSLTGVNLARLLSQRAGLSVSSYLREQYNRFLVERVLVELGFEAELELRKPVIERLVQTGRIAA
jgi:hypothetical protein